jgi:hypothetical protein
MVTLHLDGAGAAASTSLSGVAAHGDHLFLVPDEGASLLRLKRLGDNDFGDVRVFGLADLVDLPGAPGDELDLEGLDVEAGALWVVGSQGAVRSRAREDDAVDRVPKALAKLRRPVARTLVARVPLIDGPDGPTPVRVDPAGAGWRSAARLPAAGDVGGLAILLDGDDHLGPFLAIPSKDNGLDVEGAVVADGRLLLGLRGPVLRGWAVILALAPRPDEADPTVMALDPTADDPSRRYVKHFLDLDGLGVRDLARDGDDLLILAGPTMVLDGPSRVLRLPGGAKGELPRAVHRRDLQLVTELTVGVGEDHPEAITVLRGPGTAGRLLVAFDSPAPRRLTAGSIRPDILPLQ